MGPDPVPAGADDGHHVLARLGHVRLDGPAQHLGHARVALEYSGVERIAAPGHREGARLAARLTAGLTAGLGNQLVDGGLSDTALPEGGQHLGDVVQEGGVRPDDQHARAAQPLRERVQQVGGPVQADRGLAGSGRPLDAQRRVEIGADEVVLVGLDGGDDVAHRADAGALDLVPQDLRVEPESLAPVEVLVFERGQLAGARTGAEPEPAPQGDAHPVCRGGAVERAGDRGPPVDHHRVELLVAYMSTADVQHLIS